MPIPREVSNDPLPLRDADLHWSEVLERIATQGLDATSSTPAEFAAFVRNEIAKWSRIAKEANIKAD